MWENVCDNDLGTSTVSILQSSCGSRLQSSVGMFWIRSCCSSRQTWWLQLLLLCGDNLKILVMIWPSLPDETRNWRAHRSPWESNFDFPKKVFINKQIQILTLPWCLSAWCVWRDLLHRLFLECALKIKFDLQTEIQKCSLKIKLKFY